MVTNPPHPSQTLPMATMLPKYFEYFDRIHLCTSSPYILGVQGYALNPQ
jgi:hypothetical protein